jgi:diadenosine tetraphosphate (Ap4A) HIT family hydrolase
MSDYIDYRELLIKEFHFWNLQLHTNQYPYIGRCYAWCKGKAKNVLEMNAEEEKELFSSIIPKWWDAVKELYQSEWPNVACYGNTSPHLHWHLIPRFNGQKKFYNVVFEDKNQGKNYAPYEKKGISLEIMRKIKNDITSKLKPSKA